MREFVTAILLTILTPFVAIAAPGVVVRTIIGADPALNVSAYSTEDEKLEAVLTFVFKNEALRFGWPANYQSLWCPTNVFNLLKRLDQAHVDLSRANVWYILPPEAVEGTGDGAIHPRAARPGADGPISEWSFHVVLEIEGRILDLDFTAEPHVVSTAAYAGVMWQKGALAQQSDARPLYVRQIPAREYLAQYSNNWTYYEMGGDGRYPAVEMSALLPRSAPAAH
jgi:hypothetical protein